MSCSNFCLKRFASFRRHLQLWRRQTEVDLLSYLEVLARQSGVAYIRKPCGDGEGTVILEPERLLLTFRLMNCWLVVSYHGFYIFHFINIWDAIPSPLTLSPSFFKMVKITTKQLDMGTFSPWSFQRPALAVFSPSQQSADATTRSFLTDISWYLGKL